MLLFICWWLFYNKQISSWFNNNITMAKSKSLNVGAIWTVCNYCCQGDGDALLPTWPAGGWSRGRGHGTEYKLSQWWVLMSKTTSWKIFCLWCQICSDTWSEVFALALKFHTPAGGERRRKGRGSCRFSQHRKRRRGGWDVSWLSCLMNGSMLKLTFAVSIS